MTPRTHRRLRVAVAALLATLALTPVQGLDPVSAQSSSSAQAKLRELQAQRERLRREKAQAAASVNVLQAQDAEVEQALAALRSNVESEAALLEEAERGLAEAERRAKEALEAEERAERELAELNETIKKQVRLTFAQGTEADDPLQLLAENSLTDASLKRTYRNVHTTTGTDAVEHYRTIQANLLAARREAEAAKASAEEHRNSVNERLAKLEQAQAAHEKLAEEVDAKIERALAEAASLEALDGQLSKQISSQQNALAEAVRRERAAAAARARSSASSRRGSGSTSYQPVGAGDIVSVGGIRVHRSIADNLRRLLEAAAADGIQLSGGGYRDSAGQIATRRNNCGSSHYDIYEKPASACRPPTARPGFSMHERGLAIDFTQNGRTLNRSSSGFAWLKANAATYGFYNLPSEPWHWSTNGN